MKNIHIKNKDSGNSSGGPVVKAVLPTQGCREWFLVDKLRSNMPGQHSQKKKKNIYIYIKIQRLPSWDANAGTPSMIRLPSQAKAVLTHWVPADLVCFILLETLKECIPDLFDVLCSDKTNCTEYHASLDLFPRAIWDAVFWAIVLSLAQIKLFFSYCRSCTDCFHHR